MKSSYPLLRRIPSKCASCAAGKSPLYVCEYLKNFWKKGCPTELKKPFQIKYLT